MKNDLTDPECWIPKNVFASYCGTNSEKLLTFYDKAVQKRKMNSLSLNWLAILLLPAWLGYRKQWAILITLIAIFAGISFIEAIFDITIPTTGVTGGLIVIGLMSNGFLLLNAHKDYSKLKKSGMENDQIAVALENKVSPSVPLALAGLVSSFVILAGAAIIADILFGYPV